MERRVEEPSNSGSVDMAQKPPQTTGHGDGAASSAASKQDSPHVTRQQLIDALNGDLAREYQAIIAYVNYSQVLKGAQYMNIAAELELHAAEELDHALKVAKQIDYLGG